MADEIAGPSRPRKRKANEKYEHDGHYWHRNKETADTEYYDCAE